MKEKPLTRSVLLRRPSASPMLHCHLAPLSHIKSFSSEAENYRICEGEQFPLQIFPRWSLSSWSASNQTSCYFQNLRKPAWDTKSGYYFFMVHSALFLQKKKNNKISNGTDSSSLQISFMMLLPFIKQDKRA